MYILFKELARTALAPRLPKQLPLMQTIPSQPLLWLHSLLASLLL